LTGEEWAQTVDPAVGTSWFANGFVHMWPSRSVRVRHMVALLTHRDVVLSQGCVFFANSVHLS
jgi:hypothetical protein